MSTFVSKGNQDPKPVPVPRDDSGTTPDSGWNKPPDFGHGK